jgi:hypothetical protein
VLKVLFFIIFIFLFGFFILFYFTNSEESFIFNTQELNRMLKRSETSNLIVEIFDNQDDFIGLEMKSKSGELLSKASFIFEGPNNPVVLKIFIDNQYIEKYKIDPFKVASFINQTILLAYISGLGTSELSQLEDFCGDPCDLSSFKTVRLQ